MYNLQFTIQNTFYCKNNKC